MEVRILGPLEIDAGGGPIDLGGPRQRALLALLVVEANRVVSTDRLMEGLWGEQAPSRAMAALQVLVSNLRRVLEPDRARRDPARVLVTRPPGYLLAVHPSQIDAANFEGLLARGHQLLETGQPAEASALLTRAVQLWRGPPLPELVHDEIAASEAARLQELHTVALEERVQADLDLGRSETAVAELQRLLVQHPLRERLWGLLMIGYCRSGRQADALRAFQQFRQRLGDELGLDPSPALQRLEADIRADCGTLEWRPIGAAAPGRGALAPPMLPGPASTAEPGPASSPASSPAPGPASSLAPPEAPPAPPVPTLVGRADELRRLQSAVAAAVGGRGQLVLVSGDAGLGKTRLLDALVPMAEAAGALAASGRCDLGESAPPFSPWIEVLRRLTSAIEPPGLLSGEAAAVTQLVPERAGRSQHRAVAGASESEAWDDPAHARFRLCQAIASYVRRVAASKPLVLALDDLHWADPASLDLLQILATQLAGTRLLLVASYRTGEVDDDHPLVAALAALAREGAVERIELAGIPAAAASAFVADASGTELPADLVRAVHARSDGNPFYMIELLRLLESEGGAMDTNGDAGAVLPVPVGVRNVIAERIARLTPTARTVLAVAAVAGPEFDQPLLDLASGLDEEGTLAALELGLARGILVESAASVGSYRFSHALIREAIYGGMDPLPRARLHARVGEALEQLVAAGDSTRMAELAYHFWQAVPVAGVAKAFAYAVEAADEARDEFAHERAEEQLRRALGMVDALPPDERATAELRALARLGSVLAATRGQAAPEVGEVFSRAHQLCAQGESSRDVVTALWGFFYAAYVRNDLDAAHGVARELAVLGDVSGLPEMRLAGQLAMGAALFHEGALSAALEHLERARALAQERADPALASVFQVDPGVYCCCFASLALALAGEIGPAEGMAQEARGQAAALGHPFTTATAGMFRAWLSFLLGDPQAVSEHGGAARALAEQHGFPLLAAVSTTFEGWARACAGDAESGVAQVRTGLAPFEATGGERRPLFVALEAEALHRAGDRDGALAVLGSRTGGRQHYFDAALHALRAEILLAGGNEHRAEAQEALRQAVAIAATQGATLLEERARARLGHS